MLEERLVGWLAGWLVGLVGVSARGQRADGNVNTTTATQTQEPSGGIRYSAGLARLTRSLTRLVENSIHYSQIRLITMWRNARGERTGACVWLCGFGGCLCRGRGR